MNTRALSSSSSCDFASSRSACGRGMVMTRVERTGSQGGRSSGPLHGQGHSPTSAVSPTGRSKSASGSSSSSSSNSRRPTSSPSKPVKDDSSVSGRVRVAVRLRPRNAEELIADADFADCVELQPELKRLKLRKNNWDLDTFQFDEVFTETASQKRVYEVVAKPVVESVLNGFNGTVMAYGQTGTGKTFTLGQLGEKDSAERGIMVRALEDILADVNPNHDTVTVSYFQLYLETVQDLLAPGRDNITIVEDPKTGDVSLPGATMVQVHDHGSFVQLLKTGELNRFASNTKMNTESSRSHAILLVCIKKSVKEKKENELPLPNENGNSLELSKGHRMPFIRKSKLLIVDLAGSERINKSGSEGHTLEEAKSINLSLTALGKCINALAENSSHIPIRDSKLTRLLRDSFGGSARTSLVITVGPSPRHRGETASTIMFGQRAMKVENMVKLREEFDYKSLCHKLEIQVDVLTMENERQSKVALDTKQEMEKKIKEMQWSLMEADKKLAMNLEKELQVEQQRHQDELDARSHSYQQEIVELRIKVEAERIEKQGLERELNSAKQTLHEQSEKVNELEAETKRHQQGLTDMKERYQKEISEMVQKLDAEHAQSQERQEQMKALEQTINDHSSKISAETKRHRQGMEDMKERYQKEISEMVQKLDAEHAQSQEMQEQIKVLEQTINDHIRKISYQQELEAETKRHQQGLTFMKERYEKEILEMVQKLNAEHAQSQEMQEQMKILKQTINDHNSEIEARDQREILELRKKLEKHILYQESLENELQMLRIEKEETSIFKEKLHEEIQDTRHKLKEEQQHRCMLEDKVKTLKQQISQHRCEVNENSGKASTGSEGTITLLKSSQMRDTISGQRATIAKLFEEVGLQKILSLLESEDVNVRIHAVKVVANLAAEVGLQKILSLLESEDVNVRIHAVKVVANLAAEEVNQQKIVEAGGLTSLLMLLETSEDETIQRVAAGAVANLAMNEKNQELIMKQGGIKLLARIANKAEDPQTLRMVAGAIANLCGNDKLQMRLRDEGGIKSLLGMVRTRHSDVLAQVARGVANFAKCESRGATQGHRKGHSLLIDDGALPWIVANSNSEATPIKRHIELALCHLAQQEANARDLVACGALWELVRISRECSREDIRNLCKRTLSTSSMFQMELKRMHLP